MNQLINEIERNLPKPSDFGVGNNEYRGWEDEIERLEQIPVEYSYVEIFLGAAALIGGLFLVNFSMIFFLLIFFGLGLMNNGGGSYTSRYEKVLSEIRELKSKKAEVDNKYWSALYLKIDEVLTQYKNDYLFRKRSSNYVFAENLQIYSDAIQHFSDEYSFSLSEHRDYVNSRNVAVTPYKHRPKQSIAKLRTTENKVSVWKTKKDQKVEQNPITTDKVELILEDTTNLPPQQIERLFNDSSDQLSSSASRQEKTNMLIGNTGEEVVANYEKTQLQKSGENYLADRVEVVSKTIGDGLGYDVLSFDQYGNKKFIEVKTTRSNSPTANFSFTRGELNFLAKNPDTAFVYCVFGIKTSNPRLKIYPARQFLDRSFETVEYRASIH